MIYVLTYDAPHRKTYDICNLLRAHGSPFKVLGMPFHYEKKFEPLIQHRPQVYCELTPSELYGEDYHKLQTYADVHTYAKKDDIILIGGAGILPVGLTEPLLVLNAHPGLIEYTGGRGLDALKWTIWYGTPIGVTIHRATQSPDWGLIYHEEQIPIKRNDSFHSLAFRQYEREITSLVETALDLPRRPKHPLRFPPEPNKRMPHEYEMDLLIKFEMRRRCI